MNKRLLIAFVIVDILLGLAVYRGYKLWNAGEEAAEQISELREKGTTLFPEPRPLSSFSLIDAQGNDFTGANLVGKWSLVFFGFTHCPDICPLTMKELAEMAAQLTQAERAQIQVILGTVDPERDDSATMAEYVARYSNDFVGLTGSRVALSVLTKQLYVTYSDPAELVNHDNHDTQDNHDNQTSAQPAPGSSQHLPPGDADHSGHAGASEGDGLADDYLITHSGHIALINPQGDFHGVIRPPHRDRDLLAVVRVLLGTE
ncbi:SCO family protein [Gammaproteobacteria bacterium]|nr:SCO family protein [Gammaproteobacteria bacterium]